MIGGKSSASVRPVALGSTVSSSTYGKAIKIFYGLVRSPLDLIWSANFRKGGSKFKSLITFGKSGPQNFIENLDFLLGHNPITGVLQFWQNQNTRLPLNFIKYSGGPPLGNVIMNIPDDNFYSVVGVTITVNFSVGFNDYGASGAKTPSGSYEVPMWNIASVSPDPTLPPELRFLGYTYYWTPDMGANIRTQLTAVQGTYNVYYAQLSPDGASLYSKKNAGTAVPVSALQLTFEPELGTGPEFSGDDHVSGQPLSDQQLIYPCYAGLGSDQFSLGTVGMLPQTWAEVLGSFPVHPTGDADFCDMVEDIIRSGLTQAALGSEAVYGTVHRGVGAFDFPGMVQFFISSNPEPFFGELYYPRRNVAGSILIVAFAPGINSNPTISSSLGDTWQPIFTGSSIPGQIWWAVAVGGNPQNTITLSSRGFQNEYLAIEVGGVDKVEASSHASGNGTTNLTASITTTQPIGTPVFLVAWVNFNHGNLVLVDKETFPADKFWNTVYVGANHAILTRTVYAPDVYSYTSRTSSSVTVKPIQLAIISTRSTDPPSYPATVGNIINRESLELCRDQGRAYGLYGSLMMDAQQSAHDWLDTIVKCMNAWPVYIGSEIHFIPLAEQSFAANGAIYHSPTSSGPPADLTYSDFVGNPNEPLVKVKIKSQFDIPNLLSIQHPNRSSEYDDVIVSEPETGPIALYGPGKDSPKQFRCIMDPAISRKILGVMIREQNYLQVTYAFKLNARNSLSTPGDLTTIPLGSFVETVAGTPASNTKIPIRFTKVTEDEKYVLDCEAEPFIFGLRTPVDLPVTYPTPGGQQTGAGAGPVNTPIFLEPVPRLAGQPNQNQLWIAVSAPGPGRILSVRKGTTGGTGYVVGDVLNVIQAGGSGGQIAVTAIGVNGEALTFAKAQVGTKYKSAANVATSGGSGTGALVNITTSGAFGGCFVYISTDDGASYNQINQGGGQIVGSAITGICPQGWPSSSDPDTTNDLILDLTESEGELPTFSTFDEDRSSYPCFVSGGTECIPYELMAYAVPVLIAPNQYALKATGAGNYLRRSVFSAPNVGIGADHPIGSRFAFLGTPGPAAQQGIMKLNMDPIWIGKALHFKFPSYSDLAGGIQSLSDCVDYVYIPTGCPWGANNPNALNYTNDPYLALSQPDPNTIALVPVQTQFPSITVSYAARTFTIPTPAGPTVYYVTIADPGYTGDIGASPTLNSFCEPSNTKAGEAGYTYMGFIQALPGGGGTVVGPGGWPPPQIIQVG